jgi:hypothetical protein
MGNFCTLCGRNVSNIDFYVRLYIDLGFPFLPHLRGDGKSILADGFYVIEAMVGGGGKGGLEDTGQIHAYIANLKSTSIFKTFVTGLA